MTTSRIASTKQRVHSIITMNTSVSVSTATQVLLMFCSVIVDHLISVYSLFGNCQLLKLTYIKSVYMCVTRLSYFVAKDKKAYLSQRNRATLHSEMLLRKKSQNVPKLSVNVHTLPTKRSHF